MNYFPLEIPNRKIENDDEASRYLDLRVQTHIPIGNHCGAFGAKRLHDIHTGIDLYANDGEGVIAADRGIVVAMFPFTGIRAGSSWWLDTYAVAVEDKTGVWLYGEIEPSAHIKVGVELDGGDLLGTVKRVLRNDKGRPTSMLHLERYVHGCRDFAPVWYRGQAQPPQLLDPTQELAYFDNFDPWFHINVETPNKAI